MTLPGLLSGANANASSVSPARLVRGFAAEGFVEGLAEGFGLTGAALAVVVVGVVVVVVGAVVVLVVADGTAVVVLAARGDGAPPAHAQSARQAAANQTVCRMVTEGNPAPLPDGFLRPGT